jgi:hypothetical protein
MLKEFRDFMTAMIQGEWRDTQWEQCVDPAIK